jgi:Transposase, Mutator family
VRNGFSAKTVHTDAGPVRIAVPRDRTGSFEPLVVPNHALNAFAIAYGDRINPPVKMPRRTSHTKKMTGPHRGSGTAGGPAFTRRGRCMGGADVLTSRRREARGNRTGGSSMPVELAAAAFGGMYTAERDLSSLRVSRLERWSTVRINPLLLMSVLVAWAIGNWLGRTFGAVASRLAIPSAESLQAVVRGFSRAMSTRHALRAKAQGDASPDLL